MSEEGRKVSGSTRIPVKEMALSMLPELFPHLTNDQIESLRKQTPMPPSATWQGGMSEAPDTTQREALDAALFRQIVARMQDTPLITCILAFNPPDARRAKLARKAVNQFVSQSYPHKQLVIVNGTDTRITNIPHREIKEVQVRDCHSIADLRNRGLELAEGDWAMPFWDDDDCYDPHLLTFQMMHRQAGKAVMLSHQIRVAIWKGTSFCLEDKNGIPSTAIVPRNTLNRFPMFSDVENEALLYVNEYFGVKRVVVANPEFPANALSIVTYHDNNKTPYEQFMHPFGALEHEGRSTLGMDEARHLKSVLAAFGLKATAKLPENKGEPVQA